MSLSKPLSREAAQSRTEQSRNHELLSVPSSSSPTLGDRNSEQFLVNRAGRALRRLREHAGLTARDVASASVVLAGKYRNERYAVPISRLCEFEKRGVTPSIYRLYSLAVIYGKNLNHLLRLYEIGIEESPSEEKTSSPPISTSSCSEIMVNSGDLKIVQDLTFGSRKTRYLGQLATKGDTPSLALLERFAPSHSSYGFIGSDDRTMYPLLPPSTLVQIDESRNQISSGGWASEYERPIYFVEMRGKHVCCWCTESRDSIILQPHPLSPVPPKILRNHEADVLGQVVAATVLLGPRDPVPGPQAEK